MANKNKTTDRTLNPLVALMDFSAAAAGVTQQLAETLYSTNDEHIVTFTRIPKNTD